MKLNLQTMNVGNSPAKRPRLTKSLLPTSGEDVEMEVLSDANAVGEDDLAEASLATTTNAVSMRQPTDVLASSSDLPLTPTPSNRLILINATAEHNHAMEEAKALATSGATGELLPDWRLGLLALLWQARSTAPSPNPFVAGSNSKRPAVPSSDNNSVWILSVQRLSDCKGSREDSNLEPGNEDNAVCWERALLSSKGKIIEDSEPEQEELRRQAMIPVQPGSLVDVVALGMVGALNEQ
ncbi:hypothetical protein FRC07_003587 [Ceratobasidium sp. 392]|nr:hypothetical protein FRC07_003587 [Ceratobasidium sp. 392]